MERDPEAILAEMSRRLKQGDWRNCTVAGTVRAAHVVFSERYQARFRHRGLRSFFIAEARESRIAAFRGGMMSVYLSTYEPGAEHTRDLASALSKGRTNLGPRWADLLANFPALLDARRAHESIAQQMLLMRDPWRELKESGVRSPHGPGLMSHVHLAYLKQIAEWLSTRTGIDTLVRWLKPDGQDAKVGGAKEAIEALLHPWLSRNPAEDLRGHLVDELLRLYRDPRVARGGPWRLVGDQHLALVRRWLTEQSIVFFLDVVSEVNRSHMWPERREFWLGLYEEGRVADAWVAFSSVAESRAKRIGKDNSGRELVYGRQTGPRPDTSLLILRIGDCVVVEGSHSYKVQFFRSSNRDAPRLFGDTYDCDQIRYCSDDDQVHLGDWQARVLEKLAYFS